MINAHYIGIDPGNAMGFALLNPNGMLISRAQLTAPEARARMSLMLDALTHCLGKPGEIATDLVIAREKWQPGGRFAGGARMGPETYAGLGAQWGLWKEQINLVMPFLPTSRVHSVYPSTWRRVVFAAGAKNRDAWQKLAHQYVRSRFGVKDAGDDEAVAICIACWAMLDAKVRKTIQERPRWHGDARVAGIGSDPARELVVARARIAELERVIANHAIAQQPLPDAITTEAP